MSSAISPVGDTVSSAISPVGDTVSSAISPAKPSAQLICMAFGYDDWQQVNC